MTIEFYVTTSLSTNPFNCIIYGPILMAASSPPYGFIFLVLVCLILSDGKSDHVKFTFWCWIFLCPANILGICSGCSWVTWKQSDPFGICISALLGGVQVFPGSSDGKKSTCNAGDTGSIPGSGRSPGEGNGNPLQYASLGNPLDRGAWLATGQGSQGVRPTERLTFSLFTGGVQEAFGPG